MSQQARTGGQTRLLAGDSSARSLPSTLSALFILTATVLLIFALFNIRQSAYFADVFWIAERLEQSDRVSPETLLRTAATTSAIVAGDYCRSDIVMAGATLVLSRLDAADELTNYDAWAKDADDAELYMRHAVSCMPSDSNLWLRLAVVRAVIVEEPKAISRLMTISERLAPSDEVALLARVYFWNHLNAATLEKARTIVVRDLSLLLKLGGARRVAPLLRNVSPALLPYIKQVGTQLPPDRKTALTWFGFNPDKLP